VTRERTEAKPARRPAPRAPFILPGGLEMIVESGLADEIRAIVRSGGTTNKAADRPAQTPGNLRVAPDRPGQGRDERTQSGGHRDATPGGRERPPAADREPMQEPNRRPETGAEPFKPPG
jgi:hypothetical protein